MLVMFEVTLVKQQQRNMREIRGMGNKTQMILCYRLGKWVQMPTDKLLPGDIVSLKSSPPNDKKSKDGSDDVLSPCDLVLLSGRLICDEALLTGESVPQMKEALDTMDQDQIFNSKSHQVALVSGGTKIMQHIPSSEVPNVPGPLRPTDKGCPAMVLRTGFSTTQGGLLRTILYGSKRVTANNAETGCFILILLCFAIAAASYLWMEGTKDPERSRYKLMLECTFILTSVVPPELPIQLSLAVNSSLLALSKLGLFCTEPFRIPYAGKVDIVCFDKTGTLTQDTLLVRGIAGIDKNEPEKVLPATEVPEDSLRVLAGAHSLHMSEQGIIGDPLEIAVLSAIEWTLKNDHVMPLDRKKSPIPTMTVQKKFHFSSALARMSTIVQADDRTYYAVVKGGAEVIKARCNAVPEWYDRVHRELARGGNRLLALASKKLDFSTRAELVLATREHVEKDLDFNGFLVTGSPLKDDAIEVVTALQERLLFLFFFFTLKGYSGLQGPTVGYNQKRPRLTT